MLSRPHAQPPPNALYRLTRCGVPRLLPGPRHSVPQLAIVLGCVPVFLGDHTQPWADALDYSEFSLHIPKHEINRTIRIVKEAPYERLKAGVDRVWPRFAWGGSVFPPLAGEPPESDAAHLMIEKLRAVGARVAAAWGGTGGGGGVEGWAGPEWGKPTWAPPPEVTMRRRAEEG